MDAQLLTFVGIAALLVATPGADFAVVFRNALRSRGAGVATGAGTVAGLLVHSAAAALGLSALLTASATAFTVVKLLGGGFLIWLGVRALLDARRGHRESPVAAGPRQPSLAVPSRRSALREGFVTNVLNPKAPVIFLSLMPQFIPADAPALPRTLLLSAVLVILAAAWYGSLSLLVARLAPWLSRPGLRVAIDRLTGLVLIALGVRVLVEPRPASR